MTGLAIFAIVAGLVLLLILAELIAAVVPLIIVVTMVPPEEREALAELLAAADSSRRLRLWRALRVAALARRAQRTRNARRDPSAWERIDDTRVGGTADRERGPAG